jgi:two-component system chemotaxis response regulator CheY
MTFSPTLLCIDDSKLVQSLVSRELEQYDVQLHFANDGSDGLVCCLRETPDLVMLDLRMPGMDGIEFLKQWKAELGFSDTRFIIMTSETSRDIVEQVLSFGISDYIAKPFSGKTLISRISQHIPLKLRENRIRIPQTPKLSPSQPRVPATPIAQSAQSAPKPGSTASPATITLRTIRVVTKKIDADHGHSSLEENSLQEIISKYQILLGTKNAYLTSFLAVLLKEGKVCVESDKISERIQLLDAQSRIDAPTAASLLARYFEEQRAESQIDSRSTQRIVLHPPSKTRAPKN